MNVRRKDNTPIDDFDVGQDIYRFIVESAVDHAVVTTTLDGVVTTWNAGACNILGYRRTKSSAKTCL
jgi:PAS domain S-box-containing protein